MCKSKYSKAFCRTICSVGLKRSVGLSDYFRNILQVFLKHRSRKNCVLIKIFKKQVQIKELKKEVKLRQNQGVIVF